MPLTPTFEQAADGSAPRVRHKRPAPLSIRLSQTERDRLLADARGERLGTYIKSRLFGGGAMHRPRATTIADQQALAKLLALLGRSHLASNLNQLAKAVNIGALPLTPETEAELLEAILDVRAMRHLLVAALGRKPEAAR